MKHARSEYLEWIHTVRSRPLRCDLTVSGHLASWRAPETSLKPPDALQAVREGLGHRYGVEPGQVLPTLGTSLALFLAVASRVGPGDRVVVETPTYDPFHQVPRALGASVVQVPRLPEEGWAVRAERFLDAVGDGAALVVVSDPHNPTGVEAGPGLDALRDALADRRVPLLVDEVYRDFLPGAPSTRFAPDRPHAVVSSLTKVYGLGGLRAGWVLAPAGMVRDMTRIQNLLHVDPPDDQVRGFAAALEVLDGLREEARERAAACAGFVRSWEPERFGLRGSPGVGLHFWFRGSRNMDALCNRLLEEHGVAVVPGRLFGEPRGFRVAGGAGLDVLREGLEALEAVLARA